MNTITAVVRVVHVGEVRHRPDNGPTFVFIGTDLNHPEAQFYVRMAGEHLVNQALDVAVGDAVTVIGYVRGAEDGRVGIKARAIFLHVDFVDGDEADSADRTDKSEAA